VSFDRFAKCSTLTVTKQPFLRRLVTRLIGLVPSMVVAIAVGRPGINTLLVASQVALSIVLPFVAFPLIWLTSSKSVMRVKKPGRYEEKPPQASAAPEEFELPTPVELTHTEDEGLSVSS
jgi:metal iron transporter